MSFPHSTVSAPKNQAQPQSPQSFQDSPRKSTQSPSPLAATSPAINLPPATGEDPSLGDSTVFVSASTSRYGNSDYLAAVLRRRFSYLNHAKDLLRKAGRRTRTGKNPHRTIGCHHHRIDREAPVDLINVPAKGRGVYGNLQKCSNVWACPVCGAKVSERRRVELERGLETLKRKGYSYVLVTTTLQHRDYEPADYVLEGLKKARRSFLGCRKGRAFLKKWGYVGQVNGTEATYGANGWHPHTHDIYVLKKPLSKKKAKMMEAEKAELWGEALERFGRFASVKHGVKISVNDRLIADYLTKMARLVDKKTLEELKKRAEAAPWKESHEITKAVVKRTKGGDSRTPTDLLWDSMNGDERAGELWLEYEKAFSGTRQLRYSPGLKALMEIDDKSDEEIASEKDEIGQVFARFWKSQFRQVRQNDILAELQFLTGEGDQQRLKEYLEDFGITGVIYPALGDCGDLVEEPERPAPESGPIDAEGLEWSEIWDIWVRPAALAKVDAVPAGGPGPGLAGDAVPVPVGDAAGIEAIQAFNDFVARWNAGEVMESEFFSGPD